MGQKSNQLVVFGQLEEEKNDGRTDSEDSDHEKRKRFSSRKPNLKQEEDDGFETELVGHSEKILGKIAGSDINFSRYEEQVPKQAAQEEPRLTRQYPDQSFVNLNDSFTHQPRRAEGKKQPSAEPTDESPTGTMWPSAKAADNGETMWPSAVGGDDEPMTYNVLKTKFEELQDLYEKDKKFYDTALEQRTNQLEEKEDELEKVSGEKD